MVLHFSFQPGLVTVSHPYETSTFAGTSSNSTRPFYYLQTTAISDIEECKCHLVHSSILGSLSNGGDEVIQAERIRVLFFLKLHRTRSWSLTSIRALHQGHQLFRTLIPNGEIGPRGSNVQRCMDVTVHIIHQGQERSHGEAKQKLELKKDMGGAFLPTRYYCPLHLLKQIQECELLILLWRLRCCSKVLLSIGFVWNQEK